MKDSLTDMLYEIERGPDTYSHVLVCTRLFEPDFFESDVLPVLYAKDAEIVLVLCDRQEYDSRFFESRSAGADYHLDYCHAHGQFNPRFTLAVWKGGAKLVLGGVDATRRGWTDTRGIMGCITYRTADKEDEQGKKIFSDFRDFLLLVASKKYIRDKKSRQYILEICEMLPESEQKNVTHDASLVHNLEKPILRQVLERLDEPVESVAILAPYLDDTIDHILEFFENTKCAKISITIPPEYGYMIPRQRIAQMTSKGVQVAVNTAVLRRRYEDNRAAVVTLNTATRAYCIYGGAGMTSAGLLSSSRDGGDVEVCAMLRSRRTGYYDDVVAAGADEACAVLAHSGTPLLPDKQGSDTTSLQQVPAKQAQADAEQQQPLVILGASIEAGEHGSKKLHLHTDRLVESGRVILARPHDYTTLEIRFQATYMRFAVDLDSDCLLFCMRRPAYVQVIPDTGGKSGKRWIYTGRMPHIPKKSDVDIIKETRGRLGLITLLYKIDKFACDPRWFYHFIPRISSRNIDTINTQRLQILQRQLQIGKGDTSYDKASEVAASGGILELKFEKAAAMTKRSLQEMNKFVPKKMDAQLAHFILWSKVIIWFVTEKRGSMDNLRFIRMGIASFLDVHKKNSADKNLKKYLNRVHFWEHALWLLYLVLAYQTRTGFSKKNTGIAGVFKGDVDAIFSQSGKKRFSKTAFEQIIREYSEFEKNDAMAAARNIIALSQFYESEFLRNLF